MDSTSESWSTTIVSYDCYNDTSNAGSIGTSSYDYTFYDANGKVVSDPRQIAVYIVQQQAAGDTTDWFGDGTWTYSNLGTKVQNYVAEYSEVYKAEAAAAVEETPATDGSEEQSEETDSEKASTTGAEDGTYKFTIASVIGQGPIMDPDLLYEHIIKEENGTNFENFHTKATADSDKVITLIGEIDATLSATNSEAFYTGETAKPNIEKMKTALENTTQGKSKIGSMDSGEVTSIIKTFNEELRGKREETRELLLKKTITEINGTRIGDPIERIVDTSAAASSSTAILKTLPSDGQRDETGYCVWKVYPQPYMVVFTKYTAVKVIQVDVSGFTKANIEEMENIIEKFQSVTGKGLPYDKNRIVND